MDSSRSLGAIVGITLGLFLTACAEEEALEVVDSGGTLSESSPAASDSTETVAVLEPDLKPYVRQWSGFPSFGEGPEAEQKHVDACVVIMRQHPLENISLLFQARTHVAVVKSTQANDLGEALITGRESNETIFDIETLSFYSEAFLDVFHRPVVVDLEALHRAGGVEVFAPKDKESRARDELDFTKVTFDQGYADLLGEALASLKGEDRIYLQLHDHGELGVMMGVPPVVIVDGVASVRGVCTGTLEENFDAAAQRLKLTHAELADGLASGEIPVLDAVEAQAAPQPDPVPWEDHRVEERTIDSAPGEITRNLRQFTAGFEIGDGLQAVAEEDTVGLCVLTSIGWSRCSSIGNYPGAPDFLLGPVPAGDETIQLWLASSTEFYEKQILIGEIRTPEQPQQHTEELPTYRIDAEVPVRTSEQLFEGRAPEVSVTFVG